MEKRTLILDKYGQFLGKHSERLMVKEKGQTIEEVPLLHLETVLITSRGVLLSSDAVEVCAERGIDIILAPGNGAILARLSGPTLVGTVKTRREQLFAYQDQRGFQLAKAMASGKISNQKNLLRYFAKYRKTTDKTLYAIMEEASQKLDLLAEELEKLEAENIDSVREQILNVEGRSASLYWDTIKALIADDIAWLGREHRGATDPINSALNYGYAILYTQVDRAVVLAGLDPFAGFVHVDRSGKPSLVLDLIEEFRQPVVDRAVFSMLGKGTEIQVDDNGMLKDQSRRTIAEKVLERLDGEERYKGAKHKLKTIILRQAQSVASFLRGEEPYKPFVAGW
jgi:CRISPR-associated protein Cas1